MVNNKVDIKSLFCSLQQELEAALNTGRIQIPHQPTKGDVSETTWRKWLENYLPKRYAVEKGIIVDSKGNASDQIDIVIYDKHYSPFIFNKDDIKFIPAESVYCVFEVKQVLDKSTIDYAVDKASSVNCLFRTSAKIKHAGGTYEATEPFRILCGILTTSTGWSEGLASTAFKELMSTRLIDFGCSIDDRSFSVEDEKLKVSLKDESLIFFFLKLLDRISKMGTVPAISIEAYAKAINSEF